MIYPIPKDHDQAYFNSNGILISAVHPFKMRMLVGFRKNMKLRALNYKAWHFDKTLLKDLSKEDWLHGVLSFQAKLSDAVIEDAARQLPPEVYQAYAAGLTRLLRIRRDKMQKHVMHYYHFLQSHPQKVNREQQRSEKKKQAFREMKH